MTKIISLLVTICCLGASNSLAQKQKAQAEIPVCPLSAAKLVPIRGFQLGQSYAEVIFRLEKVENVENVVVEKTSLPSGQSLLRVIFPFDYEETNPGSEFSGITSMDFSIYNNKVFEFLISYSNFEPRNLTGFIKQISSTLSLPMIGWRIERQHSASLICQDFNYIRGESGHLLNDFQR